MKLTLNQLEDASMTLGLGLSPKQIADLYSVILTAEAKKPAGINDLIGRYCELWSAKYGEKTPVTGKMRGAAKNLVSDLGLPRALDLVDVYFKMTDRFFVDSRHDLSIMLLRINAVATGKSLSQSQIQQAERQSNVQSQLERIASGDL